MAIVPHNKQRADKEQTDECIFSWPGAGEALKFWRLLAPEPARLAESTAPRTLFFAVAVGNHCRGRESDFCTASVMGLRVSDNRKPFEGQLNYRTNSVPKSDVVTYSD